MIQRNLSFIFTLSAVLLISASSSFSQANTFAVVNMKDIFDQSEKFQRIASQMQSEVRTKAEEYAVQEEAINAEIEDLKQKESMMEPAVLQQQMRTIQQRIGVLMEDKMRTMRDINQEKDEALLPVIAELRDAIKAIAEEEGYLLVLNKRYLVHVDPSIEITEQVIARLNQ